MIIYFSEVEKHDETLVNIKKAKRVMEEIYECYPVLWQELEQLFESVKKKE